MTFPARLASSARTIFALRAFAAIGASAVFGLVATSGAAGISLPHAVLAGFVFGTAFVGGTGYRIIRSVWAKEMVTSPASWSGAAAASSIASIIGVMAWSWTGQDVARLVLAYALAINFAYLCVKASCMLAGCCHAEIRLAGWVWGLRPVEIGATIIILAVASACSFVDPSIGAVVGLAGHVLLRLGSRRLRGRWSSGWPPLRQPGAELAPLQVLTLITGFFAFS